MKHYSVTEREQYVGSCHNEGELWQHAELRSQTERPAMAGSVSRGQNRQRQTNTDLLTETTPGYSLKHWCGSWCSNTSITWWMDSLEKTLMLGKTEGRRRGRQKTRWRDGITDSKDMSPTSSARWWRPGRPGVLQSMGLWTWTWLGNWTRTKNR